ncbi:hypothetical protein RFI_23199 [Reticulomyxa filosa]|uniref:Beta-catenin-interacting ICAT domain-containing protein n=1 Tax=Reticulomyxa filosa TaxID=46433 RepID=X6MJH8_RETFI|nr:hypothetical protein RFI_23199 [Reticulomyxa filosa]|eukprot:ETO14168.1 hypothetical protein RFI_23199 [Reticulomyxa filosa]
MLRGKFETDELRKNIKNQLNRLLMQLEDLEKFKDEFDSIEEWTEEKNETEQQLQEFQSFLDRTLSGDMTLIDEFSSVQLAIQATIVNAFKTPEIIRLFAAKEPNMLREKLQQLQRDLSTKKITKQKYKEQCYEVLLALQKLQVKLSVEEQKFIENYEARGMTSMKTTALAENINSIRKGIQSTDTNQGTDQKTSE